MGFISFVKNIPARYRRVVVSGTYSPQVDAIRFVAIFSVILCHINAHTQFYGSAAIHTPAIEGRWLYNFYQGVCLFFVLSGYVLANNLFKLEAQQKKLNLKNYYLRRITRLEPPYFIILLFSFCALVFWKNEYTVSQLLPHLGTSLIYSNNIFYPLTHPLIIPLAWTLEVEIQFYILLPLLFFLYKQNKPVARIVTLFIIIVSKVDFLWHVRWINHTNVVYNLAYFLAGILLADIVNNEKDFSFIKPVSTKWYILIAAICAVSIWYIDWYDIAYTNRIDPLPLIILLFYYLILVKKVFAGFFTNKWISFVGGMCYSIYLTHYILISFFGKFAIRLKFTEYFMVNYIVQLILLLPVVLAGGFIFYRFVELPTMDKDWVKKLLKINKVL